MMDTDLAVAHGRARRAVIALCFPILFATLGIVSNYLRWQVFRHAEAGIFITHEAAVAHDTRHAAIVWGQWASFLLCAPLFLLWLHRAYANLKTVRGVDTAFTPGWAVGYWFIPIVNLVRPYQIVKELWTKAHLATTGTSSARVSLWWAAYLGAGVAARLTASFASTAHGLADSITIAFMNAGSDALRLLAGLLIIALIRDVDALQLSYYPAAGGTA
jgi:hypothetical protein